MNVNALHAAGSATHRPGGKRPADGWLHGTGAVVTLGIVATVLSPHMSCAGGLVRGHVLLAQATAPASVSIAIADQIVATPAKETPLSIEIRIDAQAEKPTANWLVVKGLPAGVSLTVGFAVSTEIWAVHLLDVSKLAIRVPADVTGRFTLSFGVMGEKGRMLAGVDRILLVGSQAPGAAPAQPKAASRPAHRDHAASVPLLSPSNRQDAERLVSRGQRMQEQGNIALAREFFLRAAEMGLAQGALLLAATYDPRELARMNVVAVQPDPEQARKWYSRARELGAPEAAEKLSGLR
jgi:hypothetical protein